LNERQPSWLAAKVQRFAQAKPSFTLFDLGVDFACRFAAAGFLFALGT
jgi:hypothetical protein